MWLLSGLQIDEPFPVAQLNFTNTNNRLLRFYVKTFQLFFVCLLVCFSNFNVFLVNVEVWTFWRCHMTTFLTMSALPGEQRGRWRWRGRVNFRVGWCVEPSENVLTGAADLLELSVQPNWISADSPDLMRELLHLLRQRSWIYDAADRSHSSTLWLKVHSFISSSDVSFLLK